MSGACTGTVLRVGWLRGARWAQARRNRTRSPERLGQAEDAWRISHHASSQALVHASECPRQESNVRTRVEEVRALPVNERDRRRCAPPPSTLAGSPVALDIEDELCDLDRRLGRS